MSHHNSIQNHQPTKILFKKKRKTEQPLLKGNIPVPVEDQALLIPGQGCLVFQISTDENSNLPSNVSVCFETEKGEQVILEINSKNAVFKWRENFRNKFQEFELVNKPDNPSIVSPKDQYTSGIDKNNLCHYWVSIDSLNKRLRYGKGEMRLSTALLDYQYDVPKNLFTKDDKGKYIFIDKLKTIQISQHIEMVSLWKDPIVIEPPALVVRPSQFTMNIAAKGTAATSTSLSKECQTLYGNVADFQLNTPDFPDFEQAIEYSIRKKDGIARKILEYKLKNNEFGNGETEYKEIYLRITLGQSQGESPGIPYVLEIWPVGCASPVHHHGFTHAIIKVLRGNIDVDIYRMLPSKYSSDKSLKTVDFKRDDITYLMPEINQYHLLKNNLKNTKTCITIQCYAYSKNDKEHYATFDYVEDNKIGHFDPISDCDFLEFKAKVKEEWNEYLSQRFWLDKE
ncbi:MAG: cysteine dioxygenase [Chitinophagales bacterium]